MLPGVAALLHPFNSGRDIARLEMEGETDDRATQLRKAIDETLRRLA